MNTEENKKTVRCAIIGMGTMGKKYAAMLHSGRVEGLSLTAVCCHSGESAKQAEEDFPGVIGFGSEDDLYEHSDLFDAVIIVTPHKLHPQMSMRALDSGKHVMCDKPAAVTAADAMRVNEVAERSGRIYAMMCHQRTYDKYKRIKSLLDGGKIGEIVRVNMINTTFLRPQAYHLSGKWRSSWTGEGGGALINQGYHLIDMWQYLFGVPEYVYAEIPFGKYNNFAVDDESTIVMKNGNMTGTFIISTGEGAPCERLEISGTRGKVLCNGENLEIISFGSDMNTFLSTADMSARPQLKSVTEKYPAAAQSGAYEKMLKNFADGILCKAPIIARGEDSAKALEIINAAYLSAWRGGRVRLPIDDDEYLRELKLHEEEEKEVKK